MDIIALYRDNDVIYINMDHVVSVCVTKDYSSAAIAFDDGSKLTHDSCYDDVEEINRYFSSKSLVRI